MIYLDNNATTFLDPAVKQRVMDFLQDEWGNPSSLHKFGQRAKSLLSHSRKILANFLKCSSEQILFTSGGTEGAFLAIHGLLKNKRGRIVTSNVEHACVYETLRSLEQQGAEVVYLPAGELGAINPEALKQALSEKPTDLVVLIGANNETGVLNDIEKIAKISEGAQVPLVIDAVQLPGKVEFSLPSGVSAAFFSAHKFHALPGVGFLYVKKRSLLNPIFKGGAQEFGLRGGTENLLGIAALAKAIEVMQPVLRDSIQRMAYLRDKLEHGLLQLPRVFRNGLGHRICNTTNLAFEGQDGESLLIALDQAGLACSLGAACSAGAIEPSRILLEMGLSPQKAQASLRFSLSRFTTEDEITQAIALISSVIYIL